MMTSWVEGVEEAVVLVTDGVVVLVVEEEEQEWAATEMDLHVEARRTSENPLTVSALIYTSVHNCV